MTTEACPERSEMPKQAPINCPKCGVSGKIRERDPDVFEYQCPRCSDWLQPPMTYSPRPVNTPGHPKCRWCGKNRKPSNWEQESLVGKNAGQWLRLCDPCANRRLNNPWNALLPMRKMRERKNDQTARDCEDNRLYPIAPDDPINQPPNRIYEPEWAKDQ